VALLATVVVSMRAQIALHAPLVQWHTQRSALCSLLQAELAVAAVARQVPHPRLDGSADHGAESLRLLRRLRPHWTERLPAVADYANLLLLYQYRLLGRQRRAMQDELPALQAVFWRVGALELDLALWHHLRRAPVHCQAQAAGPSCLTLDDVVHPLLAPAHPVSLHLVQRGAIVTGQNGVGKSTLLRTVGLNVIVARAFGFCYARRAELASAPGFTVFSSLQVEDSLHTATSLFMAELARAQALVQATQQDSAVLLLVDEIFRGTNPLESVAATAALAKDLAGRARLVLATHHLVLAPLLAGLLQALCIERGADGAPQLKPGVLAQTNGLALMADHGFSLATQATAATVLAWLQAWMTHPTHLPPLD
jgi:DNA mismatch repair ATPase MutS